MAILKLVMFVLPVVNILSRSFNPSLSGEKAVGMNIQLDASWKEKGVAVHEQVTVLSSLPLSQETKPPSDKVVNRIILRIVIVRYFCKYTPYPKT